MQKFKVYFTAIILGFLSLAILIQLIIPYPYGLVVAMVIFIIMPLIVGALFKNKINEFGVTIPGSTKFRKVCSACRKESNNDSCPRCGSKSFKYE